MKNIISVLVIALLLLISCKKEFLEVIPKSSMTTDLVFKTDNDFKVGVIGIYRQFQDIYDNFWEFGDLRGDDCEHWALRSIERVNTDEFSTDVNSDLVNSAWQNHYSAIRSANTVLSKLESADPSIITGKDQYEGEVRFLRALAYFNLVRIFGDVPMVTVPILVEDALVTPRTNVDIIYDEVIIPDLLVAEAKLPAAYSAANLGPPTKGAAKSLLGKVYLTIKDFPLAESKLMEVTTMGYDLLDNWDDLFNLGNEHHSEYIFDIEYIGGNVGLGSTYAQTFSYEDQDVGQGLVDALRQVFNYKGPRGGSGCGSPSQEFIDLFDPDDLRKDKTVRTGIYDLDSNWVVPSNQTKRFTLKWVEPNYDFGIGSNGVANWRVIRYADVLLMLAEAMNENGKTNNALTYLNQVRERAGLEGYSGLTKEETLDKILDERRFELFLEGHRWFDLVRTGRALSACADLGMKAHMTVFPVPQTQIEVINDPAIFPQNNGY